MSQQAAEIYELESVEIQMCESQMEAWIELPAGTYVGLDVVKRAIHISGLCFGLRLTALREILLPTQEDRRIVLATGRVRIDGEDGRLQMHIEDSLPYSIREDGSYDYHGVSSIATVHQGSCVAEVLEPSDGEIGMTVKGVKVHPHHGVEFYASALIGEGTLLQGSGEIVAEQTGVFSRNRAGKLQVTSQVIIEGDVDLSVGNIDTDKPVLIRGDIKSGFIVKSASDITVNGVIENSRVSAGGNLIVHKGILPGSERVKAHGKLCAKYIQERHIECQDLAVESIIRHAQVSARSCVHAQSVIGGHLSAGMHISVMDLGNQSGEPTHIRVGVDAYVMACIAAAHDERASKCEQYEMLKKEFSVVHKKTIQLTAHAQDLARRNSPRHIVNIAVKKAQDMTREREEQQELIDLCEAEIASCEELINSEKDQVQGAGEAAVEVVKNVYPGVEIGFGTLKKKNIISTLTAVTFQCVSGDIIVRL